MAMMATRMVYLALAIALFRGLVPATAHADIPAPQEITPEIDFDTTGVGLVVTIRTPGAGMVQVSNRQDGFLLKFSTPLASEDSEALLRQSKGKLSNIEEGYDSLLFESDTMKLTDVSQFGRIVKAVFTPAGAVADAGPADISTPQEDETKLVLTRALISSREGDFAGADQYYNTAMILSPDDPEIMASYAGNEEEAGNWRHAQDLYHAAAALDPDDQEAAASSLRIDQEHQRYAGTDFEWRDLQGFGIVLASSTTLDQPLSSDWRALAQFDSDHISTNSARRPDGRLYPADQWASSESIGAGYDNAEGVSANGYLFTGYTPGTAGQVSLPTDRGHFLAGGEWDRPNWDYLEGLVNDGTRDRLYIGQQQVFSYDLSGELIVGYNAYNLGSERDLANGPAVSGELRYQLIHDNPSLAVVYNLDAEYSATTTKRMTNTDEQYEPFPLINREVHTVILDMDSPVADFFNAASRGVAEVLGPGMGLGSLESDYGQIDLFAGGGADRYGRGGPLVGGTLTKSFDRFEIQFRTSYEKGLDRESQSGTIAGGYLKARF